MKQYILKQIGDNEPIGKYSNKADAVDGMDTIIADHNEDLDSDDDGFLTPFDFTLEVVECQDVNETITNFDEARAFLGGKPNNDYTVSKKVLSGNCVQLADVTHLVQDVNPKHIKALIALNELFTIAQAWNKADDFVPDFSNSMQDKWFPWFVYDKGAAGFVCAYSAATPSYTHAYIGSRLCFKTRNRAIQFGKQFVGLYNQVFLLDK
jgi:hypothetical protein|nr:MAG TPA: hypothetical protein [Caudoviricetes sp.]